MFRRVREGPLPPDWPEWAADKQARARHSRADILESLHLLLQSTAFDEISTESVASASGLSIGAVYARFPSKNSILQLLALLVAQDAENHVHDALANLEITCPVSDVAQAYVGVLVDQFVEHRSVIRQLRKATPSDVRLAQLMDAANRRIHAAVCQRIRAAAAFSGSVLDEERLAVALLTVNASAREIVIAGVAQSYDLPTDPASVARFLGQAFIAQLS